MTVRPLAHEPEKQACGDDKHGHLREDIKDLGKTGVGHGFYFRRRSA